MESIISYNKLKQFEGLLGNSVERTGGNEDAILCDLCGNPIAACMCVCPYCGERDACECCLFDAATGGG